MSGYPTSLFVHEPAVEVLCGICLEVLHDPHQCSNGHSFCHSCLKLSVKQRRQCPTCSVALPDDKLYKSLVVSQLIQQMDVKCTAHNLPVPCQWTGPLEYLEQHVANCNLVLIDCPLFKASYPCSCDGKIARQIYYSHISNTVTNNPEFLASLFPQSVPISGLPQIANYIGDKINGEMDGQGMLKVENTTYNGGFVEGEKSGFGVYTCPEYTACGEWLKNKLNGECIIKYKNGSRYVGEMKDGEKHGNGELKDSNKNIYIGSWKCGKRNGHGTITFHDGTVYTGQFVDDQFNGVGCTKQINGVVYKGEYVNNLFHGHGKITIKCGEIYEGSFQRGMKHGYGVLSMPKFGETYRGEFKNNMRHGQCILRYQNGDIFEGEFSHDEKSKGIERCTDGSVYEGSFHRNKFEGKGTCTFPNKDVYVGEWLNGEETGHGTLTFGASGNVYSGEFLDRQRHGKGVLVGKNGKELQRGKWRKGKFITAPVPNGVPPTVKKEEGGNDSRRTDRHSFSTADTVDNNIENCVIS